MKKVRLQAAVAAALCALAPALAAVQERPSTLADQQSVAVTIYNENLALVKDTRRIQLDQGQNRLALREVSGRMRPAGSGPRPRYWPSWTPTSRWRAARST